MGIARQSDGRKIIVTGGVLPGMRADVLVTKNKKDYTEGKLYHVRAYDNAFTPEPAGVKCPHYTFHAEDGLTHEGLGAHKVGCGGCKRQILNYDKQLLLKQQIVEDSFRHIKDTISQVGIRPFLPAPEVYGYRNKIEYSFGKYITATDTADEMRQERQLGFHKQGQFSKVIDIDACYLVTDTAKKLFTHLKKFFAASGLPVYDQKTHSGFLRHLVVREGVNTGHFLVNLSVSEAQLPALHLEQTWEDVKAALLADEFLKELVTTFVITVNDGLADVVKGESMHTYLLR